MQDKVYAAVRILQKGLLERETEVRHFIEEQLRCLMLSSRVHDHLHCLLT